MGSTFRRIGVAAVWICAFAAAALLYRYDPKEIALLPKCVFHEFTGLHCPGCGSTRALHSLVHGDFSAALHYNLFFVALAPVILWLLVLESGKAFFGWEPRLRPAPAVLLWALFGVLLAFTVFRNIPSPPFDLLRP